MKVSLADFGSMTFKVRLPRKILRKYNYRVIFTNINVKVLLSEYNHENITQPEDTRF